MNAMAEALGMSLTGNSAIPAPFRERMAMAYETGKRIVQMVLEDLKPSDILTREAFENAIVVNSAIGGIDQRAAASAGDRAPCRRGAGREGLGNRRLRRAAAGEHAAGGRIPGRKLLPRGRRARR